MSRLIRTSKKINKDEYKEYFLFVIGFVFQLTVVLILYQYYYKNKVASFQEVFKAPQSFEKYDESLSKQLHNEVRILCMVLTYPAHHMTKAIHVNNTWGRKCTKLLFLSYFSETSENGVEGSGDLKFINLPITDSYKELWNKTKLGLRYLYANYIDQYDWFLKADDDRLVVYCCTIQFIN